MRIGVTGRERAKMQYAADIHFTSAISNGDVCRALTKGSLHLSPHGVERGSGAGKVVEIAAELCNAPRGCFGGAAQ